MTKTADYKTMTCTICKEKVETLDVVFDEPFVCDNETCQSKAEFNRQYELAERVGKKYLSTGDVNVFR